MKKIVIIDDDTVTLGLLSRVLEPFSNEFEVITAEDAMEAIKIVSSKKIDLLLTDLRMPVMDGFELIAYLTKNHPEIPVFAMTAFGSPEIKSQITSSGRAKYFEKPLNTDLLTEAICEELDAGAEGQILGISLPSFLQLVEMEQKTCTLNINSDGDNGTLYFVKGEMVAAETGSLRNEKAAYEILSWDKTSIEIKNFSKKKDKEIKQPLMNILMEGLKIKDDRDAKKAPKKPLKAPSSEKKSPTVDEPRHSKAPTAPETKKTADIKKEPKEPTIDVENKIEPPPETGKPETLSGDIAKLSQTLKSLAGIYEYKIFDKNNFVQDKSDNAKMTPDLKPSTCFSDINELKGVLNYGVLNFFVINTKAGIKHLFFDYCGSNIVVALKPGLPPREFMKKINIK